VLEITRVLCVYGKVVWTTFIVNITAITARSYIRAGDLIARYGMWGKVPSCSAILLPVKPFIFMTEWTRKYYVTEHEIRKAYGDVTA